MERVVNPPPTEVTTNHDPFDVYIDEVRFIPDGATVIKVNKRLQVAYTHAHAYVSALVPQGSQ